MGTVHIADAVIVEGDTGRSYAEFTVTFSRLGQSVAGARVDYATADATATLADRDYHAKSGTLRFADGEVTGTIRVPVFGDRRNEPDEHFVVNLSNPRGGGSACGFPRFLDRQGLGGILNDDPAAPVEFAAHDAGTMQLDVSPEIDALLTDQLSNSSKQESHVARKSVASRSDKPQVFSPPAVDAVMDDATLGEIGAAYDDVSSDDTERLPRLRPRDVTANALMVDSNAHVALS